MSMTILVADDENLECDAFEFMVSKSGFDAVCIKAKNGKEAVEKAQLYRPQVIVLDIQMPVMTGLEAAEKIRSFLPEGIIVFLTAWGRFDFAQKALRLNATDYLVKPIDENSIQKLLETCTKKLNFGKKAKTASAPDVLSMSKLQKKTESLQDAVLTKNLETAVKKEQELLDAIYNLCGHGEQALKVFMQLISVFCYTISQKIPYLQVPQNYPQDISSLEQVFAEYVQTAAIASAQDRKDKYERIFSLIMQYIDAHFMEVLDTDTVCKEFNLHPGYFPQLFKKYCGKTFVEYLTDTRMKYAAEAIKSGMTIKDSAKQCGFSDTNYFTKVFHKYYGCTPSEYAAK